MDAKAILEAVQSGSLDIRTAMEKLRHGFFDDLGHSRVDIDRESRNGSAEVIFGSGKTPRQITEIAGSLLSRGQNVLATRISPEAAAAVQATYPEAEYNELARILTVRKSAAEMAAQRIVVACAGTSDLPVAEEARLTAEFFGSPVDPIYDAGVAGLHRLMADLDRIRAARVVIVVAGMEGALPSVVGGLVDSPVIAVPTSVGYGASFGGIAALLGMLNSCASGVSVVNIDNGFGAGFLANRINRL